MVSVALASGMPTEPGFGVSSVRFRARSPFASARFTVVTVNVWLVMPAPNVRVPDFAT